MPSPIEKSQFFKIAREVRESSKLGKYNAEKIAKQFNVSRSTVSTIRRAKTWDGFVDLKDARQDARRNKMANTNAAAQNLPGGRLNTVLRNVGLISDTNTNDDLDRALAVGLEDLEHTPTRHEFEQLERLVISQGRKLAMLTTLPLIGRAIIKRFEHRD